MRCEPFFMEGDCSITMADDVSQKMIASSLKLIDIYFAASLEDTKLHCDRKVNKMRPGAIFDLCH